MQSGFMRSRQQMANGDYVELYGNNVEHWKWNPEAQDWTLAHDGPIYSLPEQVIDELLTKGYIKRI